MKDESAAATSVVAAKDAPAAAEIVPVDAPASALAPAVAVAVEPAPVPVPTPEETAQAETEPGYSVGAWAGMPKFQCALCPYDTLIEAEIQEHVINSHAPPAPSTGHKRSVRRFVLAREEATS